LAWVPWCAYRGRAMLLRPKGVAMVCHAMAGIAATRFDSSGVMIDPGHPDLYKEQEPVVGKPVGL
jgi:hypothetical protein